MRGRILATFTIPVLCLFGFVAVMLVGEHLQQTASESLQCMRLAKSEVPIRDWPIECKGRILR
jgi:hypothetical protein